MRVFAVYAYAADEFSNFPKVLAEIACVQTPYLPYFLPRSFPREEIADVCTQAIAESNSPISIYFKIFSLKQ